jgi:hypothetical protein
MDTDEKKAELFPRGSQFSYRTALFSPEHVIQ